MNRGVYTIEDLYARCRVDDETGCWLWGGATQDNRGMVWLPGIKAARNVAFAALYLTDRRPREGKVAYLTCTSPLCCNPKHAASGTRKEVSQHLSKQGKLSTPRQLAALMALGKKARLLTEEQAHEIRISSEVGYRIAERFGVSKSVVSRIRRGQHYKPSLLPGSSVFNMRIPEAA